MANPPDTITFRDFETRDRDWLIREMEPTEDGSAIVVIEKGRTAVEQYLIRSKFTTSCLGRYISTKANRPRRS